ncbi:MAG: hypothetical protein WD135_06485 [Ferruginibacter sp.]
MQSLTKVVYSNEYEVLKPTVDMLMKHFNIEDVFLFNGGRKTVKYFLLNYLVVNIK